MPHLALLALTAALSSGLGTDASAPVIQEFYSGLYSVELEGYGSSRTSGVLLPERVEMIPVPLTGEVSVRVVPQGVRSLGEAPPIAMSVFRNGVETFEEATAAAIPREWGEVLERGTFRRAGYVMVRLNPVILRDGELLTADLRLETDFENTARGETVRGLEGNIFRTVFGTSTVWREPVLRAGESPFWGKPWARIQVDTAGVFRITGEMLPEAVGMPSASFSMCTGRGMMMSYEEPAQNAYSPRSVPIMVDDGGDGTFDANDGIIFYGRGLSWWGDFMGGHFNHQYAEENTYWLTWGGQGGPFMEVLDASVTGAPSAGSSYINRLHFENNETLAPVFQSFQDQYGWHRIASSIPANYSFSTPGVTGGGTMRLRFYVEDDGSGIDVSVTVNGVQVADSLIKRNGEVIMEFPVGSFQTSGNTMAIQFSGSGHVVYTDWFEVFPQTGYRSWSTMCQVPLDRIFEPGARTEITWAQNLGSSAFACVALSDTAVVALNLPGGKDFEVPMPTHWEEAVLWVVPGGSFLEPVSVAQASPGRIMETLSSARTVYVYPDQFASDMPLFQRGRNDIAMVSLQEVFDEFNGGVRDPNAVRAFFAHTMDTWNQPPAQLVLVGDGHWDARGFTTAKPCLMDVITYLFSDGTPICSDHIFSSLTSYGLPEAAVSRIPVSSRTELQLVAQRSAQYSDPSQECGTWQSVIIGAADDERYPPTPNSDQPGHTRDAEEVFTEHIPDGMVPIRNYEIFWDWNSSWKKPECRAAFIENWSEGALAVFFLGHGSFDQLTDEGLMYIEDTQSMACGPRMPYAFFGSCDVGLFQNPSHDCIAGALITSTAGGAIVSSAAASKSGATSNAGFLMNIFDILLFDDSYTIGEAQWLGMLNHGAYSNDKRYIIFGDGSLFLALPDSRISVEDFQLRTSQLSSIAGSLDQPGLAMITAWESARPDSYFTLNQNYLIEYLTTPGVFYRGLASAEPGFTASMFVPEVAVTGDMARVRFFAPGEGGGDLVCDYPVDLLYGTGSPDDTLGPDIDLWINGFRGIESPQVSGEVVLEALLEDESGINLLPYPGNQLALYIDESPVDIADWFTYQPGSSTTGGIVFPLPELQPGEHTLRLRAADNLSNLSWSEMTFTLLEDESTGISDLFVYPTPAVAVMSFNWTQSSPGPVTISIYSVNGRRIREMGNLPGDSGYNQHTWDLTDEDGDRVASGVYVYVVSAGNSSLTGVATVAR
ncbi:MAG TPA: C25 family cysteine peptidase [Candidatus Sabulitectum sp.]|nr:C25 family cysteine peptidase [Candidatus Sabulitectum sp.]